MSATDKIKHYRKLLKIEAEEDRRQYQETVARRSLKEQIQNGVTWFPLTLKKMYIGTAERVVMEVEKTANLDKPHVFQSGALVQVFGLEGDKPSGMTGGVVYSVKRNEMKIVLGTDDFPNWVGDGRLGVTLDFDDKTYKEMESALLQLADAKPKTRLHELREIIWGNLPATFTPWTNPYTHPKLNESQCRAVEQCLAANDLAIIHGPPGTGKTTTLVQVIAEMCKRESQVMVCAASNTAVDLLCAKCEAEGIKVLRIGNPARVDDEVQNLTLDARIAQHQDYSALKKIRKEAERVRTQALKHKRNFGSNERRERKELLEEAYELKNHAAKLEEYILYQVLNEAQVIACTLTGAGHSVLNKKRFNTVLIDEASQALAPACWIPLLKANRVIFAGDHLQLPPTVKSFEAEKGGLAITLMEECMNHKQADTMLEVQYRMHKHIMYFSGKRFYEGKLQAAESVKNRVLGPGFPPLTYIDTVGCGFDELRNAESGSLSNPDEAQLVLKHLALTLNEIQANAQHILQPDFSIGIISPYKEQVQTLREQIQNSPFFEQYLPFITIHTVDGFQGQERDIIYISLVRSNDKQEIGFLKDIRRMNVALTRARKQLVVVGDSGTLGEHPFYRDFLNYIETIDAYKSAWEFAEG